MMKRKVKYEDYAKFSGEAELGLEETIRLFDSIGWNNDAFLCIVINEINLLQIMFSAEQQFMLEITNDSADMIFHQRYASPQECRDIISQLFSTGSIDTLEGYYAVQIDQETLDQVIKKQGIIFK